MAEPNAGQQTTDAPASSAVYRVPLATYRVQLRSDFKLTDVRCLLPYLKQLGISDLYLSPLFRARSDSSHGYDVVDHGMIDPAFGTLADFEALATDARATGMGILLDVVPNHMGINDPGNQWWLDVLENGPQAAHAEFFDIDWNPTAPHLKNKVLLPFLGAPFGETLERGELRVVYERGALQLTYGPKRYPLARNTWPENLAKLCAAAPVDQAAIDAALQAINGRQGEPRSFDELERLLDAQWYRLAYWRVAADEINYRRFFDINDLAAIRVEDRRVFGDVHRLVGQLLEARWVTGLRIDHPDGLYDPPAYFDELQALHRRFPGEGGEGSKHARLYVVVEKILSGEEPLPRAWAVDGTTGYDFLNLVNRLFVHASGLATLRLRYAEMTDVEASAPEIAYASKREILVTSLSSELNVLAGQLDRVARQHRASRDFTRRALERALRELIACLPVYRTYVQPRGWELDEADFRYINVAARLAKRRNPGLPHAVIDFLASVLRLENPPTLSAEDADVRRRFVLRVQQITGPAMAKGLEDTAFYRYFPLASMNEVGGELDARGLEIDEFHQLMVRRANEWPRAMSATSTHDTKRGEDFRARMHVLSEIAEEWVETVERWHVLARPVRTELDGEAAPDRNDLYLLFQTLVGTWPLGADADRMRGYAQRITAYMSKALRESKRHTSWMNPFAAYEDAVSAVVQGLLLDDRGAAFRADLELLVRRISQAGYINGLSQLVVKALAPGAPDFYQGSEFWDFNLVDPDNRRPVDFERRSTTLAALRQQFARSPLELAQQLGQGLSRDEAKQFVAWRTLAVRTTRRDAVTGGDYTPLVVTGAHAAHLIAYARRFEDQWIAAVVPRQIQCLPRAAGGAIDWQDTAVELPAEVRQWRNEFSGETVTDPVAVDKLFAALPVAALVSISN
jgi:(1->4)-alpha-D-glucan 1-alpha-D-glucosylmutase